MVNTWFHVWVQPRQVMKQELARTESQTNLFIWLAIINSFLATFVGYRPTWEWEGEPTYGSVFLISLVASPVLGLLSLYIIPWLYKWVGSWIGGEGTTLDLRKALVHGGLKPGIIVNVIALPFVFMIGEAHFISDSEEKFRLITEMFTPSQLWAIMALALVQLTGIVWSFVVSLHAIGEAHKFSAWKSLLMVLLIALSLGMLVLLLMIPLLLIGAFWL